MTYSFFEAIRVLVLFAVGGVLLAETIGPLWHIAKHRGWLGETFRQQHIRHHLEQYPPNKVVALDPEAKYIAAGEWNMYVLAVLVLGVLFLILPVEYALPVALGAAIHGLLTDYAHQAFHLKRNPFDRYQWYRKRARLHRIHHRAWGNFGILFFFIDRLLGTIRLTSPTEPENLFP
jgi:sterol desaturase/sphingolipid hydroxylase (fatty acid hydroxylase superfamily)